MILGFIWYQHCTTNRYMFNRMLECIEEKTSTRIISLLCPYIALFVLITDPMTYFHSPNFTPLHVYIKPRSYYITLTRVSLKDFEMQHKGFFFWITKYMIKGSNKEIIFMCCGANILMDRNYVKSICCCINIS